MKKLNAFLVLAMTVFFFYSTAMGATYIVNHDDEDAQFQTIQKAIDNARSNDTIKVVASNTSYRESIDIDKNLTLIGAGPQYTEVESDGNVFSFSIDHLNVTIIGFKICSNTQSGIYIDKENTILKISNCILVNCYNGIYLYRKTACRIIIQNNTILNCSRNGILYDSSYSGSYGYLKVEGNIIAFNASYGISADAATEIVKYNNVFGNKENAFSGISVDADDGNIINQDPGFLDMNYVLSGNDPKSPCIDKGIIGDEFADPDQTRNDIGAFGGPNCAPFWPYEIPGGGPIITNLDVTPTSVPKGHKIIIRAKGRVQ